MKAQAPAHRRLSGREECDGLADAATFAVSKSSMKPTFAFFHRSNQE